MYLVPLKFLCCPKLLEWLYLLCSLAVSSKQRKTGGGGRERSGLYPSKEQGTAKVVPQLQPSWKLELCAAEMGSVSIEDNFGNTSAFLHSLCDGAI